MKRVIIAALILLFTLATSIGSGIYLNHSTNKVVAILEETKTAIEQEDWESALTLTEEARQRWMDTDFFHHLILKADSIESISIDFRELQQFLRHRDQTESAASSSCLTERLRMTAYKEQFRLENIF